MGKRTRPTREAHVHKSPHYVDLARKARIVNRLYFFKFASARKARGQVRGAREMYKKNSILHN